MYLPPQPCPAPPPAVFPWVPAAASGLCSSPSAAESHLSSVPAAVVRQKLCWKQRWRWHPLYSSIHEDQIIETFANCPRVGKSRVFPRQGECDQVILGSLSSRGCTSLLIFHMAVFLYRGLENVYFIIITAKLTHRSKKKSLAYMYNIRQSSGYNLNWKLFFKKKLKKRRKNYTKQKSLFRIEWVFKTQTCWNLVCLWPGPFGCEYEANWYYKCEIRTTCRRFWRKVFRN